MKRTAFAPRGAVPPAVATRAGREHDAGGEAVAPGAAPPAVAGRRWGWRKWAAVAVASALSIACLGATVAVVAYSFRLTNPPEYLPLSREAGTTTEAVAAYRAQNPRTVHGLEFRDVEFPATDGSTLHGWLVPGARASQQAGIVAAHARAGDRRDYLDQLGLFHALGATVLLLDYREHGVSDGNRRGMGLGHREAEDVTAAARYLKEQGGVQRIAIVGHSLGGSAAILAAARDATIDGVLAESSIASFDDYVADLGDEWLGRRGIKGVRPATATLGRMVVTFTAWRIGVPNLRAPIEVVQTIGSRPLVLVHGSEDMVVKPEHSRRLAAQAGRMADLWLAPGAGHNAAFETQPDTYASKLAALLTAVVDRE